MRVKRLKAALWGVYAGCTLAAILLAGLLEALPPVWLGLLFCLAILGILLATSIQPLAAFLLGYFMNRKHKKSVPKLKRIRYRKQKDSNIIDFPKGQKPKRKAAKREKGR